MERRAQIERETKDAHAAALKAHMMRNTEIELMRQRDGVLPAKIR